VSLVVDGSAVVLDVDAEVDIVSCPVPEMLELPVPSVVELEELAPEPLEPSSPHPAVAIPRTIPSPIPNSGLGRADGASAPQNGHVE
jgi:hypothetical protein